MPNLPEPVRQRGLVVTHPSVVRAAVGPTAIAVTAAGALIGVLAHSIVLAVALGAGAWFIRMLVAMIVRLVEENKARPRPAQLDPWSVPEPWRQLVQQAQAAQTRFDQTVKERPEGPIRDRLVALQPRLYAGMEEVASVAKRGAAIGGWSGGVAVPGRPSKSQLSEQLREVEQERQHLDGKGSQREAVLARTEEAIAAQLRSVRSAEEAAGMVHDRLRVLVASLDQSVTSLLSLGVDGADAVEGHVQELAEEITALSRGLKEASNQALPPSPPSTP